MSLLPMITLDDREVSRIIAKKAIRDSTFKENLLGYARPDFSPTSKISHSRAYGIIQDTILNLRKQIADQAGLKAPLCLDQNTFLKRGNRVLLGEEGNRSWGWLVSHQKK